MDTRALQSISDKRRFRTLHRDATRTVPAAARSTSLCHKAKEGPSQIKQRTPFPLEREKSAPLLFLLSDFMVALSRIELEAATKDVTTRSCGMNRSSGLLLCGTFR